MINKELQKSVVVHVVALDDLGITQEVTKKISAVSVSVYVRALLQNWRQGTVACKDRGEVISRSNKKPWKQKGTGRARAGSPRSPLWRGGGVVFGPQERVRTLKVSKALKKNVLQSLFWNNLNKNNIFALDWMIEGDKPKTALAYNALKQTGLQDKKIILFVDSNDYQTHASFANIPNVRMLLFDQANAYALMDGDCWVFLKKDNDFFKEMVNRWI